MNTIGRKNVLFGLVYFLATLGLGMFLAYKSDGAPPEWFSSTTKALLGTAHSHGNLESVLNIVFGYLICRIGSPSEALARTTSILLIIGAIFHSGTIYLAGAGITAALNFTLVGAICLVVSVILMIPIAARGLELQAE